MKFIVSSSSLLSHLQSIGRVINPKSPMTILENFLFDIQGNTLTITASDLETTLVTTLEVEQSSGDIKIALNAKLLMDTLREFSEQPLQFEVNTDTLAVLIKTDSGSYNSIGQKGDEYPKLPAISDEASTCSIAVETILAGISKATFATAEDDLRPTMTGIYFDMKPGEVTFVATDAHKLVRFKNYVTGVDTEASFILPKKPASLLKAILPKEKGEASISFDNKNITFKLGGYTMICRQIEGRFPNYNGVIPQNNPIKVIVDRVALLNAAKRVSIFSNQGTGLIKLSISNSQIVLTAQDIDFSISAEERMSCQYTGSSINIGFRAGFLIDILNNINASDIVIELADPSRAGVILPLENEPNEELLMLLMPMMIND